MSAEPPHHPTQEEQVTYWRQRLSGEMPILELPLDYPRPPVSSFIRDQEKRIFSPELHKKIETFSIQHSTSPFVVLLTALTILLFRYTHEKDLMVGWIPADCSSLPPPTHQDENPHPVIFRMDLSGRPTVRSLLDRVAATVKEAVTYGPYALQTILREKEPKDTCTTLPFRVLFDLEDERGGCVVTQPTEAHPQLTQEFGVQCDLFLTIFPKNHFNVQVDYDAELFEPTTIQRLTTHYHTLLNSLIAHPDFPVEQLSMLTEVERHQVFVEWNPPIAPNRSFSCIHHLFEWQEKQTPDSVAVVDNDRHLTYRALHSLGNRFARVLQQHGVGPEVMVGLYLNKSIELIVGLLGILKAGGAYVPLDTDAPIDRVSRVIAQADLRIILMDDRSHIENPTFRSVRTIYLYEFLTEKMVQPAHNLQQPMLSSMKAYMIFTSGSAGMPKGVIVSHQNLLNAYYAWEKEYHLGTQCTAHLQMANVTFDVFTGDLVRTLGSGSRLILCSRDSLLNPQELYSLMKAEQIVCAEFVPGVLTYLLDYLVETQENLGFFRLLIVGSELLGIPELRRIRTFCKVETRLINSYGLTEATIDSSFFEEGSDNLPAIGSVPIGRPFSNMHLFVFDRAHQPVPIKVTGEVYIGGEGIAHGYWGRPDLTAERFLPYFNSTEPGMRVYRTGDLGRYYSDGNLQLVGRTDQQVKIRGIRIELREIEAVLDQHPTVQESTVLCWEDGSSGEKHLAAYVVCHQRLPFSKDSLRKHLQGKLPQFMIPSNLIDLEEFPRLPSGKINRRVLPIPETNSHENDIAIINPRTFVEEQLAHIWKELLNLPTIDVRDNFFHLGGHSLLATRLLVMMRHICQSELPLRVIFDHPTLEDQALIIEEHLLKEIEELPDEELQHILKDQKPE